MNVIVWCCVDAAARALWLAKRYVAPSSSSDCTAGRVVDLFPADCRATGFSVGSLAARGPIELVGERATWIFRRRPGPATERCAEVTSVGPVMSTRS